MRVRATGNHGFTAHDWALDAADRGQGRITLHEDAGAGGQVYANMYSGKNLSNGVLENGRIRVEVNADGVLSFYNQKDRLLLQENWRRLRDEPSMALDIPGREYKVAAGDCFATTVRFHGRDEEKIFGMGQYQQKYLNMKGCMLELAQRNSQVSVPFYVSSIGYGFLWNNPAVGRVAFGMNGTEWHAECTRQIDYLVIAGDTPAQIEETYMSLTGRAPMMPEYGLGFWQCKLRYQTQEQLLTVARKYKELGLPLDVIVADFFHWTQQGEYKFDPKYWPDVPAMCQELEEMGVKLMVSIWPTVDYRSENFREMMEKGYLVRTEHGVRISMTCFGQELFFDATNPEAVRRIYEIKKRADNKSMLVLLDDAGKIASYADIPDIALDLIEVTDKPTTIIYPNAKRLAPDLIAEDGTIGIRITREEFTQSLLYRFNRPLVSTSANISGEPSPRFFNEISETIRNAVDYIVNYRRNDHTSASPSSIIKLGLNGEIQIIRK